MIYFKHVRRQGQPVEPLLQRPASRTRLDRGCHRIVAVFFCLIFTLQIANGRDASAKPRHFRVGACLAATDMPPYRMGESKKQYYQRAISELEDIANAITLKVHPEDMQVEFAIFSSPPALPAPRKCALPNDKKQNSDIWLALTYTEGGYFTYEVSQRDGEDFKMVATSPDPLPDASQTRALLADAGYRLVSSMQAKAIPVAQAHDASTGIIFIYDSSGSMYETDHGGRNRLNVGQSIGEIVANTAKTKAQPLPFAVVVFDDSARTLDSKPGSKWFETTPADLQVARAALASALTDIGNTNIEAAFKAVKQLIDSRKDIERWHVIFLTDGEPTAGTTNYEKLTKKVADALGGRSTLSVIALYGPDPLHTEGAKLAQLVRTITMNDTEQSGETINLKTGDDPSSFRRSLERIAFLINGSTLRDEVVLKCASTPTQMTCELDNSQPHALRFGAAQKVTFIADTPGLAAGRCTARIENQGLGSVPITLDLPEGESSTSSHDPQFTLSLSRSSDRVFLTIEMTSGRVNGDWQIGLTVAAATARKP